MAGHLADPFAVRVLGDLMVEAFGNRGITVAQLARQRRSGAPEIVRRERLEAQQLDARQQLEAIFSAAKAAGHIKENPAAWKDNLKHLMPKTKRKGKVRGPQKALPFEELPAFMTELAQINTVSARMLEVCILTASRTVEIRHMRWSDIDLERALWRVPRELMKMDYEHVVPLSKPVMTFLRRAYEVRFGDYVFPGRKRGEPMSDMTMLKLLQQDMERDATVHGPRAPTLGRGPMKRRASPIKRLSSAWRTFPVTKRRRLTGAVRC